MTAALRLLRADRGGGPGGGAAGRGWCSAGLPGAGLGFAKPLGLLLVTWLVWMLGSLRLVADDGRDRGSCAGLLLVAAAARSVRWRWRRGDPARSWLCGGPGPRLGAGVSRCFALAAGSYSPDVWRPRSRWTWRSSTPSADASPLPARRPVDGGEKLNYYYLGHLMAAGAGAALGGGAGRRLQPRGRDVLRALGGRGVRARLRARRPRCGSASGAWRCASWRGRSAPGCSCTATPDRCATYDWFGASRVIKGTINEFPSFSFTLAGPAWARDGDPVHAPGARVRAPARGRRTGAAAARAGRARAAGARRSRSGRCTRSTRGRCRSSRGWWRSAALVRGREAPTCASGRGRSRGRWLMAARAARRAAVPAHLRHGGRGFGSVTKRASFSSWARDTESSTAFSPSSSSGLLRGARALAPSVADGGLGARGGAVRRLAAGGRGPDRRRGARRAVLGRRARGVPDARSRPPSASSGC